MAKKKENTEKPNKGLSDKELIEKYEGGKQPIGDMITVLLSKPSPNAPLKIKKA
jgi:hypothetical protein